MLWLFERDEESLKLETRYDNDRSEFMAFIRYPDGHEHTERFSDAEAFRSWLVAFEGDLETQRWTLHGSGPVFLPHGWPATRLIAGTCPICGKPVIGVTPFAECERRLHVSHMVSVRLGTASHFATNWPSTCSLNTRA